MIQILNDNAPALTSIFATLMTILILRIEAGLKARNGKQTEALDRQTLQSALQTGAELAVAVARKDGKAIAAASEDLIAIVLGHVRDGSPDALKGIPQAQGQVLKNLATVALQRQIDKSLVIEGAISPSGIVELAGAAGQLTNAIVRK
ncbi:hypothetical protein TW83_10050 [Paracoccus sp. S4493]|uniref:hypothetical protein n=1 Tax=Paracoccus sp. S4493 TaxID=579490 RepID=UPI0005FA7817|nr:hypothetical protein [Paracoccus sp. S4493]KJZ31254.1 hypothetical protein TW83_10050 [Paracoccus sp. S4493]